MARDYKKEYQKFQSSQEAIDKRTKLNKINRDKGTYGNGDGKDVSHMSDGSIILEKASKNRGNQTRTEGDRKARGYSVNKKNIKKAQDGAKDFMYLPSDDHNIKAREKEKEYTTPDPEIMGSLAKGIYDFIIPQTVGEAALSFVPVGKFAKPVAKGVKKVLQKIPAKTRLDDVNRQIKKYEDTPGYKNIFKSEDELRKQYGPGFDKAMEEYANRDWRSGTSIRDITKKYGVEDATYEIEKLSNYKHMLNTRSNILKEMPTKTSGSHKVISSPRDVKGPVDPVEFQGGGFVNKAKKHLTAGNGMLGLKNLNLGKNLKGNLGIGLNKIKGGVNKRIPKRNLNLGLSGGYSPRGGFSANLGLKKKF